MFSKKSFLPATFLVVLLAFQTNIQAQPGCRDPQANNYNPSATSNDGSCLYDQTPVYTPPVKVDPMHTTLQETSGLQWAGEHLWSFNDGGGAAAIYKIDTLTNTILQTVNLAGATNVDWEDIAFDGVFFYIGDFGNNLDGARTDLKIYKFPLSAIPVHTTDPVVTIQQSEIQIINFTYSDQLPQPPVGGAPNATKFDCEAMIVDGGKIHLFTKNWIDNNSTHYTISDTAAGTYTAMPLETLATGYLVTGADKAVGEEILILLGYQTTGSALHFLHILSDYNSGFFFNGNKRKIDLPDVTVMGQAEAITFRNGTYGYISNERFVRTFGTITITTPQRLRSFNTSNFVSQYILPVSLRHFNVVNKNGTNKLSWAFTKEVKNLEVQHSPDGDRFTVIHSNFISGSGQIDNKNNQATNYYRLSWQQSNGEKNYSHVLVARNKTKEVFTKHQLFANGLFSFYLNADTPVSYSFRVVDAEGKQLAQIPARSYLPGFNKLSIPNISATNRIVFIVASASNETMTKLVLVQ